MASEAVKRAVRVAERIRAELEDVLIRGIVRDPALYHDVESKLRRCAENLGLAVRAWLDSPITGGDGNREFFIWLKK